MKLNVNHCEPWENMCGLTASMMKHITGAMINSVNTTQMSTLTERGASLLRAARGSGASVGVAQACQGP